MQKHDLVITRVFDAPIELVWRAWTEPDHVMQWWGPNYFNTPKLVVSTTLDKVEWQNSTLIKENLAQEVARLKQQPGKNIGVAGSPTLVYSLLQNDLLDELILMVHPVIVGSGKRLFKDGGDLKRLQLVGSKTTGSGVAILTYQPRSK